MKIIGIDPGYATLGWGIVEYQNNRFTTVDYGAVLTPAEMDFPARLVELYDQLGGILALHTPDAVAVERLYFTTNQKTAIQVASARGVILLLAAQRGVPLGEYTPLQVKQAVVGYGKAVKSQVMEMTRRILNLSALPKPDDTADALAIAICHAHTAGSALGKYYK